jgi:hypothetical protein
MRLTRALALAAAVLTLAACGDLYSRTDFTTMVMNKSESEVRKQVGKPSEVDASNPKRVIWTYTNTTFDIDNQNKRDAKTMLILEPNGSGGALMVTNVEFG